MTFLKIAFALLKRVPWWVYVAIAVALIIWRGVAIHEGKVEDLKAESYAAGQADTRAVYAEAQRRANQQKRAEIAEAIRAQDEINEEKVADYEAEIARIDARADALRVQLSKARTDPARSAGPGVGNATGTPAAGAVEAPAENGLPWSVALPLLTQAEKNQAQLFAILDWNAEQQALEDQRRRLAMEEAGNGSETK